MQEGNLVALGEPRDVLTEARIRQVFGVDAEVEQDDAGICNSRFLTRRSLGRTNDSASTFFSFGGVKTYLRSRDVMEDIVKYWSKRSGYLRSGMRSSNVIQTKSCTVESATRQGPWLSQSVQPLPPMSAHSSYRQAQILMSRQAALAAGRPLQAPMD